MSMPSAASVGELSKDVLWYKKDLPEGIETTKDLLRDYSGIPADKVEAHIKDVRDRAWSVYPYGSVGMFGFLKCNMTDFEEYPEILERLKNGQKLLDLGCCFAQELRPLVHAGVPSENLFGADLHGGFMEIGYELFLDKEKLKSRFIVADIFVENSDLKQLDGQIDIIHASSFYHLFDWDDQIKAIKRTMQLLKPQSGSMIVGRQAGNINPGRYSRPGKLGSRYRHDVASWQNLWKQVGEESGTEWDVSARLEVEEYFAGDEGKLYGDWNPETTRRLVFAARRV